MLSFHNDPKIKAKYLKRVRMHQKADHLIRGEGWDGTKGCAVGCTLEAYNHSLYPLELGIPEWLARVEDRLFEGMSLEKSKTWPEVFLRSIKPGVDLELVKGPFLIMVLESAKGSFSHEKYPKVLAAIEKSIRLWKRKDIGSKSFKKAAAAAADNAAAAAAAAAAAYAAYADAAYAHTVTSAVAYAVYAANAANAANAKGQKHDYFADELVKLLKNQK